MSILWLFILDCSYLQIITKREADHHLGIFLSCGSFVIFPDIEFENPSVLLNNQYY